MSGHSTLYQLVDIFHQVYQSIDSKMYICMIFCDISKALDRVWHQGLLFKLKQSDIDRALLNWIENYLVNRTQKVFIGSSVSTPKQTTAGVPKVFLPTLSVLRPLFFLVYVNDIAENLLSITRLFADDNSLAFTSFSLVDLEGILNHDLRIISSWARRWLVDFNPNKTIAMLFTLEKMLIFLHFYLTTFL